MGALAWNCRWEMAVVVREVGNITPENPHSHLPYPFFSEVRELGYPAVGCSSWVGQAKVNKDMLGAAKIRHIPDYRSQRYQSSF